MNKAKIETIEINGVQYAPVNDTQKAETFEGMEYCIVRTYSAGVHAGYVEKEEGKEVTLRKSRRIWYWDGAASLSQLAVTGTSKPSNCKFAMEVDTIRLKEAIEVIPCTEKAMESISSVSIWTA